MDKLPTGWIKTVLTEAISLHDNLRIPLNVHERSGKKGAHPYYGANGQVDSIDEYLFDGEYVLLAEDGGHFEKPDKGVAYIADGKFWVNNHAHVLSGLAGVPNQFIKHQLNNINWMPYVGGSTRLKLTQTKMKTVPFLLPPIKEQKRIADKIDALFARSKKSENALREVSALLEQYRQSVLAAAFRGDLTKNWRINNDQNISKYLNAIRVKRTEEATTPIQKKNISYIYEQFDEAEFNIPTAWSFTRLDKLVSNFSYGSSQKSSVTGSIPVLRMGNIQRGEINWEKLVFSSDKKEINKYTLNPNDVLFNRTNSPKLVGKTAIYRGEKPAIYAGYLIRVRPHKILNPEYLNYCLGSQYGRDYCWKVKSDGANQSNINAKKLAAFKIPLCCPAEQTLIVKKIKEHFSFIEKIEYQCNYASNQISPLKTSILAKAFRGGLAPQDPSDEPANELLKRIKIERTKFKKKLKSKKKFARKKISGKNKKMIIPIVDVLKQSEKPLSAQQLLSAAGYPNNANTDQIEQFFLDIRKAINDKQLKTWRENDQDYFKVTG